MLADDALRGRSLLQLRNHRYSLCRPLPKGTLKTSRDMLAGLLFQGLGSGGMQQRIHSLAGIGKYLVQGHRHGLSEYNPPASISINVWRGVESGYNIRIRRGKYHE